MLSPKLFSGKENMLDTKYPFLSLSLQELVECYSFTLLLLLFCLLDGEQENLMNMSNFISTVTSQDDWVLESVVMDFAQP